MTAKKKTLIELMLDAGIKPENLDGEYEYIAQDSDRYFVSYERKPYISRNGSQWFCDGGYSAIDYLTELCKNWKRTIITKQQFVDAYNEEHGIGAKTNVAEDKQVEDVEHCKVVIENNTALTIHADVSDIDTEKFKREFYEAGKHCALTPSHYSVINGKDLIARSADSYKTDEFRGAMRFNIEKYVDRLGKKDSLVKELRKIADYANRWADYEEKLQGSK